MPDTSIPSEEAPHNPIFPTLHVELGHALTALTPDWVRHLEQCFTVAQEQADLHADQPTIRRLYLSNAACFAGLLAQHYLRADPEVSANTWVDRATRYNRRAFRPSRKILKNIGANMP